jgi:hypothetical protein
VKATMLGRMVVLTFSLATALTVFTGTVAHAQQAKPSILVIMGDDIGYWNISAYNREGMGYRTPNIDRIANAKLQAIVGQHLQTFRDFLRGRSRAVSRSAKPWRC